MPEKQYPPSPYIYPCEACGRDFKESDTYIDDDGQRRFRPHKVQIGIIDGYGFQCHGSRGLALTNDEQKAYAAQFKAQIQARLREVRAEQAKKAA